MEQLKLYMLLLGSKAPGRHVEQHDFFFGIGKSLKELVPLIKDFWREAGNTIHIDGYREVNVVSGYKVSVQPRTGSTPSSPEVKLFFINLGGYTRDRFEEQHYTVLTVKPDRAAAFRDAKDTLFFKTVTFKGAESHIDDKYGIDVDDLYQIEEILPPSQKDQYKIVLTPDEGAADDKINLGYYKLNNLT